MSRVSKSWKGAAAAALLLGALVGVARARPTEGPEPAIAVTHTLTISPGSFQPAIPGIDYHYGSMLQVMQGDGVFLAPVAFPTMSKVRVVGVWLFAADLNPYEDVVLEMDRDLPDKGWGTGMADVSSTGSQLGPEVKTYKDDTIDHAEVSPAHAPSLWLSIRGPNILVHGVRIRYQIVP